MLLVAAHFGDFRRREAKAGPGDQLERVHPQLLELFLGQEQLFP